jgi:hypothetical protein
MLNIYISTSNKYIHLIKPFQYLFNKFWSDKQKVTILGYEEPNFKLEDNFNFVSLGKQTTVDDWCLDLTNFFESIDDEYFIHAVEDQFIIKPVNQNMITKLTEMMNPFVGRIALETAAQTKPHKEIYNDDELCVIELDQFAQYRLSVVYSIWNKKYMLKYLKLNNTPWEFELDERVKRVIESIVNQNISEYEIIIVGGENNYQNSNIRHFYFNENDGNFTAKKNSITRHAKYDNIVYTHDYVEFLDGWYDGFLKFGDDWDICMNTFLNSDDSRFRDWCAWDDPDICINGDNLKIENDNIVGGSDQRIVLVPYDYKKTNHMYISGTYWIAKKKVMLEEPLNEDLNWGEAEDVEWSHRVRNKYKYVMNPYSKIKSLKEKKLHADIL